MNNVSPKYDYQQTLFESSRDHVFIYFYCLITVKKKKNPLFLLIALADGDAISMSSQEMCGR